MNPGEEAIFIPLEEPRAVRNGTAWVVRAKILKWQGQNSVQPSDEATVYMQTLLAKAVMMAIQKYGVGNVAIYAKNLGKPKGKMYYDFEVKVAKVGK